MTSMWRKFVKLATLSLPSSSSGFKKRPLLLFLLKMIILIIWCLTFTGIPCCNEKDMEFARLHNLPHVNVLDVDKTELLIQPRWVAILAFNLSRLTVSIDSLCLCQIVIFCLCNNTPSQRIGVTAKEYGR